MPRYSNPKCPVCGEELKSKRDLAKHLINAHELEPIKALSMITKQEDRVINGEVHCLRCGTLIPSDKIWNLVIDKGKLIPNYCSLSCQKKFTIMKNHWWGYSDSGIEKFKNNATADFKDDVENPKDISDQTNFVPHMGFSNKLVFEKSLETQSNLNLSKKKLYFGCISLNGNKFWKVGISNTVFLRWATILKLIEGSQIIKLYETAIPEFDSFKNEQCIHSKLRDLGLEYSGIPNKYGEFTENGKGRYRSCTGSTEWFTSCSEDYLTELTETYGLSDVTESFIKFIRDTKIEEVGISD